jgi:hypothetical protein
MAKRLDRSRPFATVNPPTDGAHYSQDGVYFDNEGNVVEKLTAESKDAFPQHQMDENHPAKQQVKANTPSFKVVGTSGAPMTQTDRTNEGAEPGDPVRPEDTTARTQGSQGPKGVMESKPNADQPDHVKDAVSDPDTDVNVEAYLTGQENYDFNKVRAVVRERKGKWCTSKRDLVEFLVLEEKVVERDKLSDEFKAMLDDKT